MKAIKGIIPALITPFDEQGNVNHTTLRQLIDHLVDWGVGGLFVAGGTGEGLLLDPNERREILETTLDVASGRVAVVAHVGALSTRNAMALAQHAEQVGVDVVATIPPIYYAADTLALCQYYQAIANAAPNTPLWMYHVPSATHVMPTFDQFTAIMEIDQVQGIKFSSTDYPLLRRIIEQAGDRPFAAISGTDQAFLPGLTVGTVGAVGSNYNVFPKHFIQIQNNFEKGNIAEAQRLQYEANRVLMAMTAVPHIAAVKFVLRCMGFDVGVTRSPLRPLPASEQRKLVQMLAETEFAAMTAGLLIG